MLATSLGRSTFRTVGKPDYIELGGTIQIKILYEDRSVLAVDKPAGWMLIPTDWERTDKNLQLAIISSIQAGDFWAKCRNLRFLRFVHRLDAETTGIILFAKSQGALSTYSQMFETRSVEKEYIAVVEGKPNVEEWSELGRIAPDLSYKGRMKIDPRNGKEAETKFQVLTVKQGRSLLKVWPLTGRTHQIRLHLKESGLPIIGDGMYGGKTWRDQRFPMGLRATFLSYRDPFSRKTIKVSAPKTDFLKAFGFEDLPQENSPGIPVGSATSRR